MSVHNLMEDITKQCLKDLLQIRKISGLDERTVSDILAIALNKLPPKYVSTDRGEMFAKTQLRAQVETDVIRELSLAAEKVLNSSRHSDFDK